MGGGARASILFVWPGSGDVSWKGLGGHVSKREWGCCCIDQVSTLHSGIVALIVRGGTCCLVGRRTKTHGSKY